MRVNFVRAAMDVTYGRLGEELNRSKNSLLRLLIHGAILSDKWNPERIRGIADGAEFPLSLTQAARLFDMTTMCAIKHLKELFAAGYIEDVGRSRNGSRLIRFVPEMFDTEEEA